MKALAVHNSRTMCRLLAGYPARYPMAVVDASAGLEAPERVEQGPLPDVVMVDWDMPRMSGSHVFEAVRASTDYTAMSLLMVSGYNKIEDTTAALISVATDFNIKPTNEEMLHGKLLAIDVRE